MQCKQQCIQSKYRVRNEHVARICRLVSVTFAEVRHAREYYRKREQSFKANYYKQQITLSTYVSCFFSHDKAQTLRQYINCISLPTIG